MKSYGLFVLWEPSQIKKIYYPRGLLTVVKNSVIRVPFKTCDWNYKPPITVKLFHTTNFGHLTRLSSSMRCVMDMKAATTLFLVFFRYFVHRNYDKKPFQGHRRMHSLAFNPSTTPLFSLIPPLSFGTPHFFHVAKLLDLPMSQKSNAYAKNPSPQRKRGSGAKELLERSNPNLFFPKRPKSDQAKYFSNKISPKRSPNDYQS